MAHSRTRLLLMVIVSMQFAGGWRQAQPPSIQGAWRVVKVSSPIVSKPAPGTSAAAETPTGLYIFTKSHYSAMLVTGSRPEPADMLSASGDELRAVWGGALTAQAGEYRLLDDTRMVWRPSVSKNPRNMAPGTAVTYTYLLRGTDLTISGENGRSVSLIRLE